MTSKIICIMLLVVLTAGAKAQSKDEQEVNAVVEKLRLAMISGDSTSLDQLAAGNLVYGHSGGQVQDKAAFIHSFTTGQSDFVTIDLTEQTVRLSGNTAIVRHQLYATNNDNGKPGTVKLVIMLVWQKQHNEWKLIARQAVRLPQ